MDSITILYGYAVGGIHQSPWVVESSNDKPYIEEPFIVWDASGIDLKIGHHITSAHIDKTLSDAKATLQRTKILKDAYTRKNSLTAIIADSLCVIPVIAEYEFTRITPEALDAYTAIVQKNEEITKAVEENHDVLTAEQRAFIEKNRPRNPDLSQSFKSASEHDTDRGVKGYIPIIDLGQEGKPALHALQGFKSCQDISIDEAQITDPNNNAWVYLRANDAVSQFMYLKVQGDLPSDADLYLCQLTLEKGHDPLSEQALDEAIDRHAAKTLPASLKNIIGL